MRIIVIGGSGHVGTYLVPRLVEAGYGVINVSRGQQEPYLQHSAWKKVHQVTMDREEEEKAGSFGQKIADLQPDIVIDMICFEPASAEHLVETLRGKVQHFLSCGSIWVHGHSTEVPTKEEQSLNPFGDYGIKKAAIQAYLLDQARRCGFPATVIHPGHIVGPGHIPVGPTGNKNLRVFEQLARGEDVALPNLGKETLHHVHADDLAQVFVKALENWSNAVGQGFHATSPAALSMRGFAEAVAGWFDQEARLSFMPLEEWERTVSEEDAAMTRDHIDHSPCCSIAKAQRLLGYRPRYTSLQAVYESLAWLIENGVVNAPPVR